MSDVNMATIQLCGDKQNFILDKKDFKTGSKGYYGTGKMVAGGKRYQIAFKLSKSVLSLKRKKKRNNINLIFYPFFCLRDN